MSPVRLQLSLSVLLLTVTLFGVTGGLGVFLCTSGNASPPAMLAASIGIHFCSSATLGLPVGYLKGGWPAVVRWSLVVAYLLLPLSAMAVCLAIESR